MNPVTCLAALLAAVCLLMSTVLVSGQSVVNSPSYHTVSFQTGPGGRTNMGGIGSELDLFFRGLDGPRGGAGRMRPSFRRFRRTRNWGW